MRRHRARLGRSGRIVVPAEYRKALHLREGDDLLIRVVDDEIRITSLAAAIGRARDAVGRYVPSGHSLSEELLRERRAAADDE